MSNAWSFLSIDDSNRQFGGNDGYEDVFGCYYSWAGGVQNDDKVEVGDLAVLRDKHFVLGMGWIDEIEKDTGVRPRYSCEYCDRTGFKPRKSPKYKHKYKCGHPACLKEFSNPRKEMLTGITFYRADYSRTWQPLDVGLRVSQIQPAYLNNAAQQSIRPMNISVVQQIVRSAQDLGETWWAVADESPPEIQGGHSEGITKVRIGQQHFRQAMLSRFKSSCAICGPLPGAILDAAHLYPYATSSKHGPKGGLLLRRDLHALFDRMMLLIDPDDEWRVRLDPRLEAFPEIWRFENQPLKVAPQVRPNPAYLQEHAKLARASWQLSQAGP
jgi:hypothetical protein